MADNYFSSPRYLRSNGRPVVAFFLNTSLAINWATVRASAAGNPLFIFRNSGGFTDTDSDGSFAWVGITGTATDMGLSYLDGFYQAALSHSSELGVGSGYKGFNDTLASWGKDRIVDQQCEQTWLATWAEAGKYYSTSTQLPFLQIPTWNDYEEGTEIESGIDNCVTISAAPAQSSGVTVTAPVNSSTVSNPVKVIAKAIAAKSAKITAMKIYVDSVSKYSVNAASINTTLTLSSGKHNMTVQAWDSAGVIYKTNVSITVK